MSPRVGVTLSGRYRLQRLIATGGMGQVWEAVDNRLGRRVAVKVLKSEFSSDPEFIERFRAEARTTAMLNHPGIASVHDYGESQMNGEGRTAYLVMELVNGEPLNSVLKRTAGCRCGTHWTCSSRLAALCRSRMPLAWCTATSNRATS